SNQMTIAHLTASLVSVFHQRSPRLAGKIYFSVLLNSAEPIHFAGVLGTLCKTSTSASWVEGFSADSSGFDSSLTQIRLPFKSPQPLKAKCRDDAIITMVDGFNIITDVLRLNYSLYSSSRLILIHLPDTFKFISPNSIRNKHRLQ
ncbi:MAG: hypothetical protein ABIL62_03585, partial [Planctomycetota bacterium]